MCWVFACALHTLLVWGYSALCTRMLVTCFITAAKAAEANSHLLQNPTCEGMQRMKKCTCKNSNSSSGGRSEPKSKGIEPILFQNKIILVELTHPD